MLWGLMGLACCATIASASRVHSDHEKELGEIHRILEKLYVPINFRNSSFKYHASDLPKMVINEAFEYACYYWKELEVGGSGPWFANWALFWSEPERFHKRVDNFGWGDLKQAPEAKQYIAMAKALERLLQLIDNVWGRDMVNAVALQLNHKRCPTSAVIKIRLEAKIQELCREHKIEEFTLTGWPFVSSPMVGDGEKPTPVHDAATVCVVKVHNEPQASPPSPDVPDKKRGWLGCLKPGC